MQCSKQLAAALLQRSCTHSQGRKASCCAEHLPSPVAFRSWSNMAKHLPTARATKERCLDFIPSRTFEPPTGPGSLWCMHGTERCTRKSCHVVYLLLAATTACSYYCLQLMTSGTRDPTTPAAGLSSSPALVVDRKSRAAAALGRRRRKERPGEVEGVCFQCYLHFAQSGEQGQVGLPMSFCWPACLGCCLARFQQGLFTGIDLWLCSSLE